MALCAEAIALAPSPAAEATRFIESDRTSPTANTPGTLVSVTPLLTLTSDAGRSATLTRR
jgi:hypothetical protein